MSDVCEWNPIERRAAQEGDAHHGWAVWSIGTSPSWHLCADCVSLPRFARFKRRSWIGPKDAASTKARGDGGSE